MNRLAEPAAPTPFPTPWGELVLTRFPEDPRERLRAWDAADEYLLRHLAGEADSADGRATALAGRAVTVLGDRWGALTTALTTALATVPAAEVAADGPPAAVTQVSDSHLAQRATLANLARAGADPAATRLLTTRDTPPERIDVLLVRVPKSLALLEDQLHRLAPALHPDTVVLGTGMVTEIHTSTLRLFERIVGPTRTSLAVRKARLILCTPDRALDPGPNPWPHRYALPGDIGAVSGRTVTNHAGTFCADRLDIGTRFLLAHLPTAAPGARVVDLGCGNGVVGTAAALAAPGAELLFVDESHQAVASAEETFRANLGPDARAEFRTADALADADVPAGSVDLVLNNPPFHSHQATTDATAWRMFTGAKRALRPGGELWVVGNRHLDYHVKLRRLFGNCRTVAGNPKFVVLKAVKR
ncbi:16S rRNA (guanine1207-N2)-methyltransferase [Streptomyces sp. TLI_053]|uniref:methyltransferase n=1 Tax=Streptomyces sp. TLI_053 TaxID=1855352 RepID=UPI000879F0A3|nr:methyltransferase [Streptomyces sp. TLI_053]SDT79860.1 16S rRNA (guanine1207-N2)-methyltransferase [Streptomyces sp. TLI_053]